jgi:anti-sigma regulatory factor (Ser/Thr protein kinase)
MNKELLIKIKNNISEVTHLGAILEEFGETNDISIDLIRKFNLALDEILTNIISYGYEDNNEHIISVDLIKSSDTLTAIIEDDAKIFNPLQVPEPDTSLQVEEREIGGLGIHIVKKIMDSVEYEANGNKNIIKIQKKLK